MFKFAFSISLKKNWNRKNFFLVKKKHIRNNILNKVMLKVNNIHIYILYAVFDGKMLYETRNLTHNQYPNMKALLFCS